MHVPAHPPLRFGPLTEQPLAAVESLLDAAFGRDRHQRTAYRLRDGLQPLPSFSLAALDGDGILIGLSQCWPVALHGPGCALPLVLVGPVAVTPSLQGRGIGTQLMTKTLAAADAAGCDALVLIGDAPYYARFGFTAAGTAGWVLPAPVDRARLLVRLAPHVTLPAEGVLGSDRTIAARVA